MDKFPLAKYFDEVAALMKDQNELKSKPSNEDLKSIYGLFKQGTIGDNNNEKPGFFNFEAKAKWEAWDSFRGKSQDEAKHLYVEFSKKFLKDEIAAKFN